MQDILQHVLVPKHEVLSAGEKAKVLEDLKAQQKNLPVIFSSDPVIKRIKAVPGDIIRVTRASRTADTTLYYRFVVED